MEMPRTDASPPAPLLEARAAPRRGEAGFNFIEVVVAVGLLFLIAMMMLPIFSRATNLNLAGRESTVVAAYGRATQEEMSQLPFNASRLVPTAGTELTTDEVWVPKVVTSTVPGDPVDPALGEWVDADATGGRKPLWQREIQVRQFSIYDLKVDGRLDDPLPAGTAPEDVHLREVQVIVEGARETGGPLGRSRRVVISRLKAF
jgi:type II secretory pathway pseudopilin PulG